MILRKSCHYLIFHLSLILFTLFIVLFMACQLSCSLNYVLTVTELSFPLFRCLILLLYLSLLLFSFFCLSTLNDVFPKKKSTAQHEHTHTATTVCIRIESAIMRDGWYYQCYHFKSINFNCLITSASTLCTQTKLNNCSHAQ